MSETASKVLYLGTGSASVSVFVTISSVHRPHHALVKYYLESETMNLGENMILVIAGMHNVRPVVEIGWLRPRSVQ